MDWNAICLSVDVEWANPQVLGYLTRLLDERSLRATFFCTHEGVSVQGHERALHPNFRRNGETMRRFRETVASNAEEMREQLIYDFVLRTTKGFCPEATGARAHSLFYDSDVLPVYQSLGLEYDSSYFMPGVHGLAPFWKEHDVVELPIFYMDYFDLRTQVHDFRVERLGLEEPGLKVFAFHPNMVFINAAAEAEYLRTKSFYHDFDQLAKSRNSKRGVGTLFVDLLDHLVTRNLPTLTLNEVTRAHRAGCAIG